MSHSNFRSRLIVHAAIALAALFGLSDALAALDLNNAAVHRLENGLTVILLEDRNFSVASVQMLYRVGARDELTGKTGLAHFVEHMAFRDTENFPNTDVVSSIYANGGEWHGYTWTDETTYFATIPSEHLDLLLRIEADRMSRLVIAEENMEPERGAVLAEMHMYENDPVSMLIDAVMFTSFLAHPYRNNTIGWESDIENLRRQDVVDFYEQHYYPSNGVLVVVGAIDEEAVLARINELFGGFSRKPPTPLPTTIEAEQTGERRIQIGGNSDTRQFAIAYRAPSANHPDFAAFLVLQELLGGGSGVSFLQNDWGTVAREDSLLAGAADSLTTWFPPSAADYVFVIGGAAHSDVSEADTEMAIEERVRMARDKRVHASTLSAAVARIHDELIFDVETTEDAAHQLAFFEGLHALDTLLTLPERVSAVSADDVQRTAQRWLQPQRRTTGWHLPRDSGVDAEPVSRTASDGNFESNSPAVEVDREPLPAPMLRTLRGGIQVIVQQSDLSQSMHLQIVLQGNNIVADNAAMDSPTPGYTSIVVRQRSSQLDSAIREARASLDNAVVIAPARNVQSNDPESRLEQAFKRYMPVAQAAEVKPALIVVSGNVDIDLLFASLDQHFGDLQPQARISSPAESIRGGQRSIELGVPVAQAQLGYIVAAGPEDPDADAVRLLLYILAHGYEGRFGREAITRRGLAYYIDARYRYSGGGAWVTLGVGVDPQKIGALKDLLAAELQRLQDEPPTVAEVMEAKSHLQGRATSAAQSNAELADALARQWLWYGDADIVGSLQRRLAAISHQDVLDVVPGFITGLTISVTE